MNITAPLFLGVDVGTESVRCGLSMALEVFEHCCRCKQDIHTHPDGRNKTQNRYGTLFRKYQEMHPRLLWRSLELRLWLSQQLPLRFFVLTSIRAHGEGYSMDGYWAKEEADRINETQHPVLRYVGGVSPEWMLPKSYGCEIIVRKFITKHPMLLRLWIG